MHVRAYLRASTKGQDANRARGELTKFAEDRGLKIAASYIENESGAKLARPELFRLLADAHPGDILLIEQVDRLSRLTETDWKKLRGEIDAREVRVVSLDLPTSWSMVSADAFTGRMFAAVNNMMLDVLAAVARKDYDDRRRRQTQGIARAKELGRYTGRPENAERNSAIVKMLRNGSSWRDIIAATGCSRSTLSRLSQRISDKPTAKRKKPHEADDGS